MSKSESKHTPGPWTVNDYHGKRWIETVESNDQEICQIAHVSNSNLHLIIAAPELLDALIEMVNAHAVPSSICKERPAYEFALAAIAKATGSAQ